MTKYRIRFSNGRVIGPFLLNQLYELKSKGHIKGTEEAQIFPIGDWAHISKFEFYEQLMDENRTVVDNHQIKEETFVINLSEIKQKINESEIDKLGENKPQLEELTETMQMSPSQVRKEILQETEKKTQEKELFDAIENIDVSEEREDKTQINPVAQREMELLRQKKIKEEEKKREEERRVEEKKRKEDEEALARKKENEVASADESTQMLNLANIRNELMEIAVVEEKNQKVKSEEIKNELSKEEEEDVDEDNAADIKKAKRKKIIIAVAFLALAYVLFFPDEDKTSKNQYKYLPPQIVFPIPFDKANSKISEVEYTKGTELFSKGSYPNIVAAGIKFKNSYENNIDNQKALSFLVRSYAESLRYSKNKSEDAITIFNIIQSKRPLLMQDPNGVVGMNLFYVHINKHAAAADVVAKYLKLYPKNVTQDLFAVYIRTLIKLGRLDVAKQFYVALNKAPDKNHYSLEALIEYLQLNQETDKAEEYIDDGLKRNPHLVSFQFLKVESLIRQKKFQEAEKYLQKAERLALENNDIYRAKFLELNGLLWASKGNVKNATVLLKKSLEIEESQDLRMKLADLSSSGEEGEVDKLIAESKAVKLLNQARDFYQKRSYELALSYAAKATDTYPGHIASELFLAKIQLKLGLVYQGLKTLEDLVKKYPDDKDINFSLLSAYIDTYKFNDAKNRIAILSASNLKANFEYPSLNARLYVKMGDSLNAISWLQSSLKLNPLNDEDIFLLAEILIKRAKFDDARTLVNRCIELDPSNPDYRIAYSKLIYETQDDQAAVGYLLALLDEYGENPKFLSEIAIFYFRAGKVKDFMAYKEKLEKLPVKDKALYEFLIRSALLDERYNEIPQLVENLLKIEPSDLESMMVAGRVLFENAKLVEAARWFKRVQDRLSSYPKVQYYIAKIKYLSGDLDGALGDVQKDMKDNGENDTDLVLIADIYVKKQEILEAENYYKRAQKLNPKSYEALIGLADISTKRSNFDLALDLYKRAQRIKGDDPEVHRKIGDVYRLLGQGALAIESYKLYLEMYPETPDKGKIESYINLMQ